MSSISLISVTYENVADIRLDQDIVISVDLTNALHYDIASIKVDISHEDATAQLSNHTVNDVTIVGKGAGKVHFKLPEQVEGKSRHFMIRLEDPAECVYDFVEGDKHDSVQCQSNSGNLLSVSSIMTSSITMLDCYEVGQKPTKLFVDAESNLSTVSLLRESVI